MSEPLLVERMDNGVAVLTLNQPERRNAMTEDVTAVWDATMKQLAVDQSLRAVVLTGAGTAFCSGGDLSWLAEGSPETVTPYELRNRMYPFYRTWLQIRDLPVPTIAAVNGPAVGAGLCVALACDLRYAAPTARFSVPFTMLGMHPGMAATWLLPQAIGMSRAREMFFTGRAVGATEAVSWGLAVAEVEDVRAHAIEVASTIAAAAPIATRLTKSALASPYKSISDALEWEAAAQPITLASRDLFEGLAAVRERRTPRFEGR